MSPSANPPDHAEELDTELSKKYEKLEGTGPEPYAAFQALKQKIKLHYDVASDYYLSLWGEHIHHGYFTSPTQSKEDAQIALITLLLDISSALPTSASQPTSSTPITSNTAEPSTTSPPKSQPRILDVGCGVGGTSRYLAREHGAKVTGITISSKQVEIARRLSLKESTTTTTNGISNGNPPQTTKTTYPIPLGTTGGSVTFQELDAEKMGEYFSSSSNNNNTTDDSNSDSHFDIVWISEALSHFPNKKLFFENAFAVLKPGGKLVIADWFKDEGLSEKSFRDDIEPIEAGMLLPPLCAAGDYVELAREAGLDVVGGPRDISKEVARTWDISWSLVQNPSLWAFAFSQGRDGIAFLQAFRAMRRGYANGTFRYAVMAFEK